MFCFKTIRLKSKSAPKENRHAPSKTQSKIHIGMRYKGSAAAETMMPRAASLPGQ